MYTKSSGLRLFRVETPKGCLWLLLHRHDSQQYLDDNLEDIIGRPLLEAK